MLLVATTICHYGVTLWAARSLGPTGIIGPEMFDTGLAVSDKIEPPAVTASSIALDRDSGPPPKLGRVRYGGRAGGIGQSCRIVSAHTAQQIVGIVTVLGRV